MYKLHLKVPEDIILSAHEAAQAAEMAVTDVVARNFEAHDSVAKHRAGFRKSDYWMDAADATVSRVAGSKVIVECDKEGVALHYEGGTVYPKKKALAIPLDPIVGDVWPSEVPGELDVFWPKNSSHGFLKDPETSDLLYLLVPKATIPADKSVLPSDEQILQAALDAIWDEQEARCA